MADSRARLQRPSESLPLAQNHTSETILVPSYAQHLDAVYDFVTNVRSDFVHLETGSCQ
jgi:hypothetical protein